MRMTQWKPTVQIQTTGGKPWASVPLIDTQLVMVIRRLISRYNAIESIAERLALIALRNSVDSAEKEDIKTMLRLINKQKYGDQE